MSAIFFFLVSYTGVALGRVTLRPVWTRGTVTVSANSLIAHVNIVLRLTVLHLILQLHYVVHLKQVIII